MRSMAVLPLGIRVINPSTKFAGVYKPGLTMEWHLTAGARLGIVRPPLSAERMHVLPLPSNDRGVNRCIYESGPA